MTPRNEILIGDALAQLRTLAPASVDCVVSSPPYFLLRDYHVTSKLGLEDTVELWVERLRAVMAEVARVLVPSGSAWLNLGDCYSRSARTGARPKSLYLAPERLALALIEDGWIVRNRVTWAKTNPMPQAVSDRLTTTSDAVFFLTRSPNYHFDLDAIRPAYLGPRTDLPDDVPDDLVSGNPGDVWRLPIAHFRGAHSSTYPPSLVRTPLLATCPLKVCLRCGVPWKTNPGRTYVLGKRITPRQTDHLVRRYPTRWRVVRQPGAIEAMCGCGGPTRPGIVLDMYMGTGTTAVVAEELDRDWIGIEADPDTVALVQQRLGRDPTLERRVA
jgi:DNA modification methylase